MPEDDVNFESASPSDGVGLCLSGGGYRAMLFHLGGLLRLNELGWLPKLTRVASVSGGSITAGVLGARWKDLDFQDGVAANFDELVAQPLLSLAGHTIDKPSVLVGLLPGVSISGRVQKAYDGHLFHGATLQDLPADHEGPRFILLATNLSNGAMWRFSRPYMRDWRSNPVNNPVVPLAHAVAASSAFPPVLSPCKLEIPGRPPLYLTDGGVYDNLGLEPVKKNCATVLVSDGGGTFTEPEKPDTDWIRGTIRVLQVVDVQVRRLRRSEVVSAFKTGKRKGVFWAINTNRADFDAQAPGLPCPEEKTVAIANIPTRLAKLSEKDRHGIVNWGYAAADAGMRTYVDTTLPAPTGFPHPQVGLG